MPLYEDLVRRAVVAESRAAGLQRDSRLIRDLAQILREAQKGEVTIRICSWCGRFHVADEWLHLEAIGAGQQRIAESLRERATNGICDECLNRELHRTSAGRAHRQQSLP